MSKEQIAEIVKAATDVYTKAGTVAGPRGKAAMDELKKYIKEQPALAPALRNLLKPLEPASKLAAAQFKASPKIVDFGKAVATGKIAVDKAVPIANKVVRDITALHELGGEVRLGLCRPAQGSGRHPRACEGLRLLGRRSFSSRGITRKTS